MRNNTKQRAMPLMASAVILTLIGVGVASAAPCGGQNAAPVVINTTTGNGALSYTVMVTTPYSQPPVLLYISQQVGVNSTTNTTTYSSYNRYENKSGYYSLFYLTGSRENNHNTVLSDTIPATPLCGSPTVTIPDATLTDPSPSSAIVNSTNITIGQSISGEPLVNIPFEYRTINYTAGSDFIQSTYCRYLIVDNASSVPVAQSNLTLTYGNYSTVINYKPATTGKYAIGIQCIYQNDTYSQGAWQGWTNAKQIVNETATVTVSYQSSTMPPPPPPESTWSVLIDDFLKFLELLV